MTKPLETARTALIAQLEQADTFDIAIIGGGATGLGVALDAALRGFKVVLLESHDFAKGTSSRATKLVHGGVRYLAQGNVALVHEALHERTNLLQNAPHIAQPLPFVMPAYKFWEAPFYGAGLKAYDLLAGAAGLGATEFLSRNQTLQTLAGLNASGLKGGVKYWDGQFDDARLALALARTAAQQGALLLNYCPVTKLLHDKGKVVGLQCQDSETGTSYKIKSKCVINAAGVWVDELRKQDGAAMHTPTADIVAPSQGVHVVVDRAFMPCDTAMMIPKTADGRVLFAVPWLGKTILGTTDTPRHDLAREPAPFKEELQFILNESANYLTKAPTRRDIKSIWVGLRPLVKPAENSGDTKTISREHTVLVSSSGLVTVTGGKWTTYRAMAEDVLAQCFDANLLPTRAAGVTKSFKLVGAQHSPSAANTHRAKSNPSAHNMSVQNLSVPQGLHSYGDEADVVSQLPGQQNVLHPGLTEAMVRFAARHEYARTVEDVLARRSRLLFLDAKLAATLGEAVAQILQEETHTNPQLDAFMALAKQYQSLP
ncbi:MAG TPA: glycerol-3-phosphate dehydrogenase/oxidase [Burkholderiaceae bacterium]|nr:glycerol-3-phosphate dehydrogenase/oxidase [Burkholderiaceae bacterium]